MRSRLVANIVLLLILTLLVSGGYLLLKEGPIAIRSLLPGTQATTNSAKAAVKTPPPPPAKHARKSSHRTESASRELPPAVTPIPQATPVAAERRRITSHPVRLGMLEREVRTEFGDPDLRVAAEEEGLLLTTYVYLEPSFTATVVRLREGVVVAVNRSTFVASGCVRLPCLVTGGGH